MTPDDVRRYQQLLDDRESARQLLRGAYDVQQQLPAGSRQRDDMAGVANGNLDELGKAAEALRNAGIINGSGFLTPTALEAGLKPGAAFGERRPAPR